MQTILVPLDGSAFAESALPLAAGLARRVGARLILLAVYRPPLPDHGVQGAPPFERRLDAEARAALHGYLETTRARLLDAHEIAAESALLEGEPVQRIAELAERAEVDLLALATHGRGGLSRFWIGSVTDGLLRRVRVPVLVVRPDETAQPHVHGGTFRRILVPQDGTPESEQVLDAVLALAGTDGVEYTLLRVVPPPHRLLVSIATAAEIERDAVDRRLAAERHLAGAAERLRARGAHVRVELLVEPEPAPAILRAAELMGADLVALSTHGAGPIERALVGSVADKVVRASVVPVLLQRMSPRAGAAEQLAKAGETRLGSSAPVERPTPATS